MPAGELAQVREERVPAGLRRFVSELGGPSFKEAAVTGANAGEVPGPGRAGAPWAPEGTPLLPSPPRLRRRGPCWARPSARGSALMRTMAKHNPTSAGDTWNIEPWYRKDL